MVRTRKRSPKSKFTGGQNCLKGSGGKVGVEATGSSTVCSFLHICSSIVVVQGVLPLVYWVGESEVDPPTAFEGSALPGGVDE